jgi:hypothetical protein
MSGAKTISGWSHDFLRPLIRRAEDVTKRDRVCKANGEVCCGRPDRLLSVRCYLIS